jgi:hypothetical protein
MARTFDPGHLAPVRRCLRGAQHRARGRARSGADAAASQGLALVPLTDAWAERRFVMCVRGDGSAGATTRALVEALRLAAAGAR